jgi:hypothetical protein
MRLITEQLDTRSETSSTLICSVRYLAYRSPIFLPDVSHSWFGDTAYDESANPEKRFTRWICRGRSKKPGLSPEEEEDEEEEDEEEAGV